MNSDEISALVTKIVVGLFSMGMGASVVTQSQGAAIATGLGAVAAVLFGVYQHWNMRKVPEKSIVTGQAGSVDAARDLSAPNVGGRPNGTSSGLMRGLALLAIVSLGVMAADGGAKFARAADSPDAFNLRTSKGLVTGTPAPSTQASAANALSGAFGDIINFFATDFDDAAKLATEIPALQDNNGAACWKQMSSIGVLLKAHPLPLTLKAATDFEALRLLSMSINQACANPACTQVFTDLSNGVAQIGVGIPVPSLTVICAKVPTITPGPAGAAAPAPAAN